jgi:ribosomal protein S18 acetylase RimI-like enzyme
MLWRVRTTLPDRPGALALLAEQCGLAEINILGLQIFPGVEAVTDELVLRAPDEWGPEQLVAVVEASGGTAVKVLRCTEAALTDQPTRYVQAARAIVDRPMSFPEVVARLFDAEAESPGDGDDVMELTVGDVQVQIRRATSFTATEHARGSAIAALVSDVLDRNPHDHARPAGLRPSYVVAGETVTAVVDGVTVGIATLHEATEPGTRPLTLRVERDWRRRGIGTRLLVDAGRLANELGADEMVLTTASDNGAVLPMVLAAGLRGRIRLAGEELTVRVPVRDLRPLRL